MTTLTLIQGEAQSVDDRVRAVVRVLLAATGMKPVDLAERLDMSKHQVWDRLRGDKDFTVREVAAMAAIFEVPVQAFVAGPAALINAASSSPAGTPMRPKVTPRYGVSKPIDHPVGRHLSIAA